MKLEFNIIMPATPIRRPKPRQRRRLTTKLAGCVLLILLLGSQVRAGEDQIRALTDTEQAVIYGASGAALMIGALAGKLRGQSSGIASHTPNAIDRWMRKLIHGGKDTTSNFLDNTVGSVITPTAAIIGIGIMDIERREFSRDLPFFLAGLIATKGLTSLAKSTVGRARPYCLDGGCPPPDLNSDDPYHQRSFISGHTSSAFYSAAFFNHRFRRYMRRNWTDDEYRTGRWVSPLVSFGWAGLVGLSRIHSDKHYFTDVLTGAAVGTLLAELYYRLAYENQDDPNPDESTQARPIALSIKFAF